MPEELKQKILNVLLQFPEQKFSIKQLHSFVKTEMSYPTLLKWVTVLDAERKVRVEDFGNIKLIKLNEKYENE